MNESTGLFYLREDIDILFHMTPPEAVLESIADKQGYPSSKMNKMWIDSYSREAYSRYGILNLQYYTNDEMRNRYERLKSDVRNDIFILLPEFAEHVLEERSEEVLCKIEHVLSWNTISSRIGADVLIAAWLAKKDQERPLDGVYARSFVWPPIIKTTDNTLNRLLEQGLVENHFHLNGSTQSFALSWACLMNHPGRINKLCRDKLLDRNLFNRPHLGSDDNTKDLKELMLIAAKIRCLFFQRYLGIIDASKVIEDFLDFTTVGSVEPMSKLKREIESVARFYGEYFTKVNRKKECLDYCISGSLYNVRPKAHVRLLSGERAFLYYGFYFHFKKELSSIESEMFYLYLLIKTRLWEEMIQINGREGFANFSDYQDRKSHFFEFDESYFQEAQRLAVCEPMKNGNVHLLEARIMTASPVSILKKNIYYYDSRILFSDMDSENVCFTENDQLPFFYVLHFPKKRFEREEFQKKGKRPAYLVENYNPYRPRNYRARVRAEKDAKSLLRLMTSKNDVRKRIVGIDACSHEIGCRPETFATEFRLLRNEEERQRLENHLHITYHVGEDFVDICDGLRAIDEALRFLPLKRGDRIGHGMVLGINAKKYYHRKKQAIFLQKQDLLDNCVWILFRSVEMGIYINSKHRGILETQAQTLLRELYSFENQKSETKNIYDYYNSWKLRGDHPSLYRKGSFNEDGIRPWNIYDRNMYDRKMDGDSELNDLRNNKKIAAIYAQYHFDYQAKDKGLEITEWEVKDWYIKLMNEMQKSIQEMIYHRGVYIECNPTSNRLIGPFDEYVKHPIFRFDESIWEKHKKRYKLTASINTDDIGVFNTSLENEYAVIKQACCRKRHEKNLKNDAPIYDYMERLRKNGFEMAFSDENGVVTSKRYIDRLKKTKTHELLRGTGCADKELDNKGL